MIGAASESVIRMPSEPVDRSRGLEKRPVVELRGVFKSFVHRDVLGDISFGIKRGEILSVLGPSGCGKTTILRIIAGFELPDRGEIFVNGGLVASCSHYVPPEKRSVGMVFQDYALFPHMTVRKNILYGLKGIESQRQGKILRSMIKLTGLQGFEERYPHQLSGGEKQRVAVARALAPCPDVLLLDEPFSSLDADTRLRMRGEVLGILREAKTTAILVTHDSEEAFCLGDRVGVLNRGRLEQVDTPEVIYHRPETPFVAGFVGHADFITAKISGRMAVTELGAFPLEKPLQWGRAMMMIRPDDVDFTPDVGGKGMLVGREFLGPENIYKIMLSSGQVVRSVKPSNEVYRNGLRVRVSLCLNHVVLFPPSHFVVSHPDCPL